MAGLPFEPSAASPIASAIEGFSTGLIKGNEQALANQRRVGQIMFEEAKKNPNMWDDPIAAKAITAYVGGKDAFQTMKSAYQNQDQLQASYNQAVALGLVPPEEQAQVSQQADERQAAMAANQPPAEAPYRSFARGMLRSLPGVGPIAAMAVPQPSAPEQTPVPPSPYSPFAQRLIREGPSAGANVRMNEKGQTTIEAKGMSPQQIDETRIYRGISLRKKELMDHGMDDVNASIQATRDVVGASRGAGLLVPKAAAEVADTDVKNVGQIKLRDLQKQLDLSYTGRIAEESGAGRTRGTTLAKEALPLTAKEAPLWFDTQTGRPIAQTNPQTGEAMTLGDARATGVRVSPEAAKTHTQLAGAEGYLAQWKDAIAPLFPTNDESFANLLGRAGRYEVAKMTRGTLGGLSGEQKNAVTTIHEAQNNVLYLLRQIGERGNVAARLVDSASKTGPGFYETRRSAEARLHFFAGLIAAGRAASGLPLSPGERDLLKTTAQAAAEAGMDTVKVNGALDKLLADAPPQPTMRQGASAPTGGAPAPAAGGPAAGTYDLGDGFKLDIH